MLRLCFPARQLVSLVGWLVCYKVKKSKIAACFWNLTNRACLTRYLLPSIHREESVSITKYRIHSYSYGDIGIMSFICHTVDDFCRHSHFFLPGLVCLVLSGCGRDIDGMVIHSWAVEFNA